ncbi:MAG: hypothetical protein ACUVXA_18825 [Candidatus Jordarchaeum sp.]|uniref:hypothetical protein n=1 Tax=Candidatus Jordarchaeum sp. TaxID=2823881 RepID=UPI004049A1EA
MGSALMATKECPISDKIKENMIRAQPNHPDLIRELLAPPIPKDYVKVMEMRDKMSFEEWTASLERVMLKQQNWNDADPIWINAEVLTSKDSAATELFPSLGTRPKGPFSFACGYVDRIVTVKEFIENMVERAEKILIEKAEQWELSK